MDIILFLQLIDKQQVKTYSFCLRKTQLGRLSYYIPRWNSAVCG